MISDATTIQTFPYRRRRKQCGALLEILTAAALVHITVIELTATVQNVCGTSHALLFYCAVLPVTSLYHHQSMPDPGPTFHPFLTTVTSFVRMRQCPIVSSGELDGTRQSRLGFACSSEPAGWGCYVLRCRWGGEGKEGEEKQHGTVSHWLNCRRSINTL